MRSIWECGSRVRARAHIPTGSRARKITTSQLHSKSTRARVAQHGPFTGGFAYVYVKETNMYVYATLHRFLYVCVTLYMYVRILRSIVCICEYVTCAFWGGLSMLMSMLCVYSGVCNRCGGLE